MSRYTRTLDMRAPDENLPLESFRSYFYFLSLDAQRQEWQGITRNITTSKQGLLRCSTVPASLYAAVAIRAVPVNPAKQDCCILLLLLLLRP
jgi:hypothetical protein